MVLLCAACNEQQEEPTSLEGEYDQVDYDQDGSSEIEAYIYQEDEGNYDSDEAYVHEKESYATVPPPIPELANVPPVGDVVSDAAWKTITDGVSYERTTAEEKEEPAPDFNPGFNFGKGFETGLSTLAWILVVSLIVGLLFWLIARTKVDTTVDKARDFTLTDELLAASKEELEDALTQNLNRKDYRAAIRYRFGQLLQAMRKEGLLIWVPGRTNAEYQRNLQDPFFTPFGVLAKAFSYALYSGRATTLTHYEDFAQKADAFLALLTPLSPKPKTR